MNDKNFLAIKELNKSSKIIDSINNYLNNSNISNIVLNIETDIKKISMEHGDCFTNYNELIVEILDNIKDATSDINDLSTSLKNTVNSLDGEVNLRKNNSLSDTNVTKIDPVVEEEVEEGINTVPIGLGIAATGIAGAAGAIYLDANHYRREKPLDDYRESDVVVEEKIEPKETEFDEITPYHASRDSKTMEKFYDE